MSLDRSTELPFCCAGHCPDSNDLTWGSNLADQGLELSSTALCAALLHMRLMLPAPCLVKSTLHRAWFCS